MKKLPIWWKNYHGFMIIPFISMGIIVLFRYEELPAFINISFILFAGYMAFYLLMFVKNELAGKKTQ